MPTGPSAPLRADGTRGDYWRLARTPRMVLLLVLLVATALVCVRLGAWQLDRASVRGAAEAEAEHQAVLEQDPVPVDEVLAPQTSFRAEHLGVPVEVTGEYVPEHEVYVPGAAVGEGRGEDGVLVVTELRVTEGPHAGAMMPVLRGWVEPEGLGWDEEAGEAPAGPPAPADEETAGLLAVPEGEVTVTGWLKDSELARSSPGPPGTVASISSAELAGLWGGPTWSGYLVEFGSREQGGSGVSPAGLAHAPPPGPAEDTGLNIRNLAYAVEWVIFGGFALALWVRMLRDGVRNRREDAALAEAERAAAPEPVRV